MNERNQSCDNTCTVLLQARKISGIVCFASSTLFGGILMAYFMNILMVHIGLIVLLEIIYVSLIISNINIKHPSTSGEEEDDDDFDGITDLDV